MSRKIAHAMVAQAAVQAGAIKGRIGELIYYRQQVVQAAHQGCAQFDSNVFLSRRQDGLLDFQAMAGVIQVRLCSLTTIGLGL